MQSPEQQLRRAKDTQLSHDLKLPTRGNTGTMEKLANATNPSFFIPRASWETFTNIQLQGKELCFHEMTKWGGCEGKNFLFYSESAVSYSRE